MREREEGRIFIPVIKSLEITRLNLDNVCSKCGSEITSELVVGGWEVKCFGDCGFDLPGYIDRKVWEGMRLEERAGEREVERVFGDKEERRSARENIRQLGYKDEDRE